ncbi:hypothetical protein IWQ47_000493 [Aquimarina sp. EL_43]|uniref:DUF3999 family protein n=1 Tax=unclassified Aquimarina TaxID=2627091 RepID=UPI0018CBBC29|nr:MULTISPECIES: DUF3999 family protein [unclassified Aquimarina]MBG6128815.1 hypothetical protein [Aquimarina sp. EL_35]MBG6149878.1 hypothetical protein [Aquimarina sp. EL_32]MBG6167435.1 hypothetical protein [Aquimarina sp. EL_43]
MKKKIIKFLVLLISFGAYAQMDQYAYRSMLPEITDTWHAISLPDEVFSKVSPNLSDIRVFGITNKKDTIEAPYLLRLKTEKKSFTKIPFTILNTSFNEKGTYITLEIPTKQPINQIHLDFEQSNFDWLITLEGTQDRKEWYTIKEDYRILSIKNELTDYQFTTVRFPNAQYHYFRILIKSTKKPVLQSASVTRYEIKKANYREYGIEKLNIQNPKGTKKTIIDVSLKTPVPVSYIGVQVQETFDYYRPISIRYVIDSIQTQKGSWKPRYRELNSGVLNSIEDNVFTNTSTIAQKFRMVIDNHDNQPLKINKIIVKGYQHELVTRFTNPGTYYLVYGNDKMKKPSYDLNYVSAKIPDEVTTLFPETQSTIGHEESSVTKPLFANKIWLWGIMGIVILLLGGFTLSMMKKK